MAHIREITAEEEPSAVSPPDPKVGSADSSDDHAKNFGLLALCQITMRTGWIFKTESIVMPVVLDLIAGSGWLRGFLPMLSRMGQSVPPLLASNFVAHAKLKKRWLAITSVLMGALFLLLSGLWHFVDEATPQWMPAAFLTIYAAFFICAGIYQLALGTIHGKLIWTHRRGRLMLFANGLGALVSITCAWFLLRRWLQADQGNFVAIFATSGTLFTLSGVMAWFLWEKPDGGETETPTRHRLFQTAWRALRHDPQFRLLALVAASFGMSMTLFPHYQALALGRLQLDLTWLIPWLIAQNLGVGVLSIPAGWLADRFGNLLVLRVAVALLTIPPLLALALSHQTGFGGPWFTAVFVLLGVTPVTMRIFKNYSLELTDRSKQPIYLSTLTLCMSLPPILTSSLIGLTVDVANYELSFFIVVFCIAFGWLLTWWLSDPRTSKQAPAVPPPEPPGL